MSELSIQEQKEKLINKYNKFLTTRIFRLKIILVIYFFIILINYFFYKKIIFQLTTLLLFFYIIYVLSLNYIIKKLVKNLNARDEI